MTKLSIDAETTVPWLEFGVNPDDVGRALASDVKGFLSRLSRPVLERAFAPAGFRAIRAMSEAEAVQVIARSIEAGHEPAIRALNRMALCHRLVSGKREDALAMVEDAVARLDPPVLGEAELRAIFQSPTGKSAATLRERHVLLALELLERAPNRLGLFPLLDRASRVAYRAYRPEADERMAMGQPFIRIDEVLSRLNEAYVLDCLSRAFGRAEPGGARTAPAAPVDSPGHAAKAAAGDGGGHPQPGLPRVDAVLRVRAECVVFLSIVGTDRIVTAYEGAIVARDVDQAILRFAPDGRLDSYGGTLGVRIAERLLAPEGGVRYVPFQPLTPQRSAARWLRGLVDGAHADMTLESVTADLSSFQVDIKGDVSRGLWALGVSGSGDDDSLLSKVRTLTLSYRSPSGSTSRFTMTLDPVGAGSRNTGESQRDSVAITYRASGAGLDERHALERRLVELGVLASPR